MDSILGLVVLFNVMGGKGLLAVLGAIAAVVVVRTVSWEHDPLKVQLRHMALNAWRTANVHEKTKDGLYNVQSFNENAPG